MKVEIQGYQARRRYRGVAYVRPIKGGDTKMRNFTAVIERCPDTGLFVGYVPGFPGAHSQGKTLDELSVNLREVIEMLLEDGEPKMDTEFIGVHNVMVN